MSSQKLAFYLLILASIVGLSVIFVRRYTQASCPQDDRRICSFIHKSKRNNVVNATGTYLHINPDNQELHINWVQNGKLRSMQISKQEEPILESIFAERYVYVKDTKDDQWWREERYRVGNSLQELPFNPEAFFSDLSTLLTDERTVYTYVNEVNCMDEQCYRYQVLHPDMEEEEQLFVLFSQTTAQLRSVLRVKDDERGELEISYETKTITEPEKVKVVPAGKNIFLEYVELKDQEEEKDFEYLKQFQQERLESEGAEVIEYVEVTPTITPSI